MMKIPSTPGGIYNAEQSYRHFDHKVKQDDQLQNQRQTGLEKSDPGSVNKDGSMTIRNSAVFSSQERATLKALFGYESQENFSLYGRNKIHNVQSGMLLDVKG